MSPRGEAGGQGRLQCGAQFGNRVAAGSGGCGRSRLACCESAVQRLEEVGRRRIGDITDNGHDAVAAEGEIGRDDLNGRERDGGHADNSDTGCQIGLDGNFHDVS